MSVWVPASEVPGGSTSGDGCAEGDETEMEVAMTPAEGAPLGEETLGDAAKQACDDSKEGKSGKKGQSTVAMRNFYAIATAYLIFTMVDGALRMIVLFQANEVGFSTFDIALMFVLYEFFGVFTNLFGGVLGSRKGLKVTLIIGLLCQCVSIILLTPFPETDSWDVFGSKAGKVVYIMFAQSFAGIAKDMVKISGKSVTKLVTAEGEDVRLYKFVARVTGYKNQLKGIGFLMGAFFLQITGFLAGLLILLALVLVLLPSTVKFVDAGVGKSKSKKINWAKVFRKGKNFNILCVARMFLFASRDVWFEVPLPVFLTNILGWDDIAAGGFLAGWIILYGGVQSNTAPLALKPVGCHPPIGPHLLPWAAVLTVVTAAMSAAMTATNQFDSDAALTAIIVAGLFLYALVFAVNSSIHSYLVVRYSDGDKVAQSVGFYYCANAGGRLVGTLLGGVLYTYWDEGAGDFDRSARVKSFTACLWASAILAGISAVVSVFLKDGAGAGTRKDVEMVVATSNGAATTATTSGRPLAVDNEGTQATPRASSV